MKPKFNALLKASILAKAKTRRSNTPISAACSVTMDISVVPRPMVVGRTTARRPMSKPLSVPRIIGLEFSGATALLITLVMITNKRANGTASIPNRTLTNKCHIMRS